MAIKILKNAPKRKTTKRAPVRKGTTRVCIVLDKSGSMGHLQTETIRGFNKYLREQQKLKDGATISLLQFDDRMQWSYSNRPLATAEKLTSETYAPLGYTALYDAMGNGLKELQDFTGSHDKAVLVVITDGMENASRLFTREGIADQIKRFEAKGNFTVVYLGANQDAFAVGASLGIGKNNTVTYTASAQGLNAAFTAAAMGTQSLRTSKLGATQSYFAGVKASKNLQTAADYKKNGRRI